MVAALPQLDDAAAVDAAPSWRLPVMRSAIANAAWVTKPMPFATTFDHATRGRASGGVNASARIVAAVASTG